MPAANPPWTSCLSGRTVGRVHLRSLSSLNRNRQRGKEWRARKAGDGRHLLRGSFVSLALICLISERVARCSVQLLYVTNWGVDGPHQLSVEVLAREREVDWVTGVGDLRRSPSSTPGVLLLPGVRAEFIEASTSDFTTVVEGWLDLPHMPRHIEKVRSAATVAANSSPK